MSKIVVVTGGSSGVGYNLCKSFIAQGDKVINIARHSCDIQNVDNFACDLSNEENIVVVCEQIKQKYSHIDILINNAGFGLSGATELLPLHNIKNLFEVNFFAVVSLVQKFLPIINKGGKIINISSVCAFYPVPFRGIYCASKSALNLMSYSLDMECRNFGVRVCAICPSEIKTNFTQNRVKVFDTNERYGTKIENAAKKIDSKNDKRASVEKVGKKIFRLINKKKIRPYYIIGFKFKLLHFIMRFLPYNMLHKVIYKTMGGK